MEGLDKELVCLSVYACVCVCMGERLFFEILFPRMNNRVPQFSLFILFILLMCMTHSHKNINGSLSYLNVYTMDEPCSL